MFRAKRRLITVLIASTLAIGAGFAASDIAGLTSDDPDSSQSEVLLPVPEALLPPVGPWAAPFRM